MEIADRVSASPFICRALTTFLHRELNHISFHKHNAGRVSAQRAETKHLCSHADVSALLCRGRARNQQKHTGIEITKSEGFSDGHKSPTAAKVEDFGNSYLPFQLFFAEAQNEWSGCIRRTSDIGMDDSYVVQRRAMLADETR